jgi:hypothetical protein
MRTGGCPLALGVLLPHTASVSMQNGMASHLQASEDSSAPRQTVNCPFYDAAVVKPSYVLSFSPPVGECVRGADRSGASLSRWHLSSPMTFSPCGLKNPAPASLGVFHRALEAQSVYWQASLLDLGWKILQKGCEHGI